MTSRIERLNNVKMSIPQVDLQIQYIPNKIPRGNFLLKINKLILKLIVKCRGPQKAKTVFRKSKAIRFTWFQDLL